jgi:hypothetical protein
MFRRSTLLILLAVAGGCSSTLETGYKPQPLGASAAVRRSYYASPFSPEAQAPAADREEEMNARRPRPGY